MSDNNIVNISEEAEKEEIKREEAEEGAEEAKRVITLRKPVDFEGKTYTEIDLSGLDQLTGKDIRDLDRLFRIKGGKITGNVKEFDSTYLQLVASRATKLPLEFFDKIGIKDATRLEITIRNFLLM